MSFSSEVVGLYRLPGRTDGTGSASGNVRILGLEPLGSTACPDYYGKLVECPGNDNGVGEFSLPTGSIPFNTAADFFAVRAYVLGPVLSGRSCQVAFAPTVTPCSAGGLATYDGIVEPTPWVRALGSADPVGYEAQTNEYTATSAEGESGLDAQEDWPEDTPERRGGPHAVVFLVNGAPTWPVPDAAGNEFGMCLFTLGQLPGAITTTITHHNYNQPVGGRLVVDIYAYTYDEPPGGGGGQRRGQIIGHA